MKQIGIRFMVFLSALFLLAGCGSDTPAGYTVHRKEEVKLKEYTYDEIYCDPMYENDYMSPVLQRQNVYPSGDMAHVHAGSFVSDANPLWHTIYTKEDGMPSVLHDPFCYDPLCRHDDITCLAYGTKGETNLIALEDKVYIISLGKIREFNFVEYSLSSGKFSILGTYEYGGELITRMGRFIYFTERIETGQDKTGKLESVKALYRYDLETGKTDYLGQRSSDTYFGEPTPYGGEIYYNYANMLYKCDYNLRSAKKITGSYKIKIYEIRDDTVWFLTETGDKMGSLYRMPLSGGEAELLYENVTWFSMDGDTLYYSLYEPLDAFEWEIWRQTKDGEGKMLVPQMITVNNGNMVYRISLDRAGKKGGTAAPFCKTMTGTDFYLSETYAVYNGLLITHFRGPYSEGTRKGLSSGTAVIDVETGEIVRVTSESHFPDNQVFPYQEES